MEVVILAGLLGLVAIGVWNGRGWLPEWASPTPAGGVRAGAAGKPNTKLVPAAAKRKMDRVGRHTLTSNFTIGDLPSPKTEVDVPVAGSPFPIRNDLPPGTTGVQIRSKYGEPTARVTAVEGGRLLERYYYVNSDRTRLTVATLEHGLVISTQSP